MFKRNIKNSQGFGFRKSSAKQRIFVQSSEAMLSVNELSQK